MSEYNAELAAPTGSEQKGYRLLRSGEIMLPGDEMADDFGNWVPIQEPMKNNRLLRDDPPVRRVRKRRKATPTSPTK